jgi:hypothetical protein|tara:strand:- start:3205 stop:3636 length:432 start_codon:yes stop_codon:yes gene_type:complete
MSLNQEVWLPYIKFMMQTIALNYPKYPNDTTKKKYYDFIQNIPLFIPMEPMGNDFIKMIDNYPVTPYLESRLSFMKWVHYIFNKIYKNNNMKTDDLQTSLEKYYDKYKPTQEQNKDYYNLKRKVIQISFIVSVIALVAYLYKK